MWPLGVIKIIAAIAAFFSGDWGYFKSRKPKRR
jgi:hypothetical protein